MKFQFIIFVVSVFLFSAIKSVGQELNGKIDDIAELTTIVEIPFTMPDGTKLMTDIYLPLTRDSMVIDFEIPGFGIVALEVIPRGVQYIIYDSINGEVNKHPYQLPLIFARTPYNKDRETEIEESIFTLMGYGYVLQNSRGRSNSEGVYFPMFSDSWNKNPYHPGLKHIHDITDLSDPMNGNRHEDGYNSIQFINDSLYRIYQQDTFLVGNGSVGMVGYSALASSQYQAAAAHKIDPNEKGLKCLFPIVGTNENYHSIGFHNGVFRQSLVEGWITGQMNDINESLTDQDHSLLNTIHSPADFGMQTTAEVTKTGIDYLTSYTVNGSIPAYFPNSNMRYDMDASRANVNEFGEGDINGKFSRYKNMEVPIYHLSGWWDIYVNGQIDTYNNLIQNLSPEKGNKSLQKLVIGPWTHLSVGKRTAGDITYKANVNDFIVQTDKVLNNRGELALDKILNSDILQWFRGNLNYGSTNRIGEPKILIPESKKWQKLNGLISVRIPASDNLFSVSEFINYMSGHAGLPGIKLELKFGTITTTYELEVPKLDQPIFTTQAPLELDEIVNFSKIPNVRLYVPGPINDGIIENETLGNYWMAKDSFPFYTDILPTKMYLHTNGEINQNQPENDEGRLSYLSDPNNPVITVGGNNMLVNNPNGSGKSEGQKNLANPDFIQQTMNNESVIQFESELIADSVSVVGIPVATLFASSNPEDSTIKFTDTDFFVRILDVYPNGKEYFVVEGAVNARAKDYAKKLVAGIDEGDTPFENIRINKIYEYQFKMLPIAYTFGKNHKIKVLISSSNYPRYQVNANIPVNKNEFYRRKPNDGQTFNFEGTQLQARTVIQQIAFSNQFPTNIEFPILGNTQITSSRFLSTQKVQNEFALFPNPANDYFVCTSNSNKPFMFIVYDITGKKIFTSEIKTEHWTSTNFLKKGIYLIRFESESGRQLETKKIIVN